ncbi:hypothetical protein VB264_24640 [Arcicella aquatica]|uniref:Lipoprotein n=1 Tax=Arcicella aquatica TaxID=217141 RepID=A0ABU5QWC1_9BACT|nr:hypothetical protein [Arcicella aquatica]MEA5261009.1 hypothetical protein [Arcicella aquatica]
MKSNILIPKNKFTRNSLLLFMSASFLNLSTSCQEIKKFHNKENSAIINQKEIEFKHWLKDTLKIINVRSPIGYQREIKIEDDSLYLQLITNYNLKLDKTYNENNKEIIYVLDLLERNNVMPQKKFHLKLTVEYYFYISSIKRLKRDFDTEIKHFEIRYEGRKIQYKFIKGNLIDMTESKD